MSVFNKFQEFINECKIGIFLARIIFGFGDEQFRKKYFKCNY